MVESAAGLDGVADLPVGFEIGHALQATQHSLAFDFTADQVVDATFDVVIDHLEQLRVVGDDEDLEVIGAGVEQLVRFAGRVEETVSRADVVPLVGENRVIAKLGLDLLTQGPHKVGLRALLEVAGLARSYLVRQRETSALRQTYANARLVRTALAWPERVESGVRPLDLIDIGRLDFHPVENSRYPCLRLATEAMSAGGTATTILNAANEVAVSGFLAGRIRFTDIARTVEGTLAAINSVEVDSLDTILEADRTARNYSGRYIEEIAA